MSVCVASKTAPVFLAIDLVLVVGSSILFVELPERGVINAENLRDSIDVFEGWARISRDVDCIFWFGLNRNRNWGRAHQCLGIFKYEESSAETDGQPRSRSVRSTSFRRISNARATPGFPAAARPKA